MPAGQGKDAERFAAALEQGTPPGSTVDDDLARDLQIAAMLRSRGAAFAPHPDEKARAKRRLMAMLAERNGEAFPTVPAQEQTAPLGRLLEPVFPNADASAREHDDANAVTALMAPVTDRPDGLEEPRTELMTVVAATDVASADGAATAVVAADVVATDVVATDVVATDVVATDDAADDAAAGTATEEVPTGRPRRRSGRHSMPQGMSNRPAGGPRGSRRPAAGGLRRRTALTSVAALVMMVVLGTAGVIGSRDALPGDALYGVKRAAESAGLALTFDDMAKAHRHLALASTRLDELERLTARDPRVAPDPELFSSAIQQFDAATGEGSRMLLASDDAGGAASLEELRVWASEQAARLTELRPALPALAMADAESSIKLLDRLQGRTAALEDRSSCADVTSGTVDDLGPLPSEGTCEPRPVDATDSDAGSAGTTGTSDGTTSGSPDATGSESSEATSTTGAPDANRAPGILPGLDPDRARVDGEPDLSPTDVTPSATSGNGSGTGNAGGGAGPSFPAPVTLPPLMPGMPGITIG